MSKNLSNSAKNHGQVYSQSHHHQRSSAGGYYHDSGQSHGRVKKKEL